MSCFSPTEEALLWKSWYAVVFLVEIAKDFLQLALHPSYISNAEILDEEEFGESSASRAQDAELTAAEELGLMVYIVAYSKTVLFLVICIKAKSLCELNCIH